MSAQLPETQVTLTPMGAAHGDPQAPQLPGSVFRFEQPPWQAVRPGPHPPASAMGLPEEQHATSASSVPQRMDRMLSSYRNRKPSSEWMNPSLADRQ